ncbi:Sec7-domain-containing protein [Ascodesmis nigricans]|uniref:Sec7-domain-containing protein n=1 Tax=Ascodesmis nigricans TaxID=341454 RepID=A0A4S2N6Q7_9PEZI|nr:Sec7-domain-containing protein [Ascodesmis nigricans]
MVFVVQALETIGNSREAKRKPHLATVVQAALDAIGESAPEPPADPTVIFEPLRIACTLTNTQVVKEALDCIGKLISYSYFSFVPPHLEGEEDQPPLIERAIETVCDCFQGETTPNEIQLQIVKALLAAVLNDKMIVHGAGLLKAVRQTYNIFLLSRDAPNQGTAQTTLTQMVNTVFERVEGCIARREAGSRGKNNESSLTVNIPIGDTDSGNANDETENTVLPPVVDEKPSEKITLQSFENRKSFDDDRIHESAPTTVTLSPRRPPPIESGSEAVPMTTEDQEQDDEDEVFIKDAFLVFRAMCKLSIKTLPAEQIADLRSHGMRSKLLSLHLIRELLLKHMKVFVSPFSTIRSSSSGEATGFVHAIKQYLCLSLSRNAASAVSNVFEVCCEIFWLLMKHMRVMLKKEIEVFLKEIYFNVLDNKHSSVQQKQALLSVLERLCADARAMVEFYLNYDCDDSALDNMFQRIIEHLARIATTHVEITDAQIQQYPEHRKVITRSTQRNQVAIPPLSTNTVGGAHNLTPADPAFPVEYMLKRDALDGLIAVLRSLVEWSQKDVENVQRQSNDSDHDEEDSSDQGRSSPRRSTVGTPTASTPIGDGGSDSGKLFDDPNQLERVKARKTALNESIRLFNFKPKRGIKALISQGFITSSSPEHIAHFLLNTPILSKAMIGEYLGEGDTDNVATMHAFVDLMDFSRMRFVDALRRFLQSFRLPGEAQKIDRFMLKFAERYISGNPNAFANADTAYVLAYSVIMLNTDQHSDKLKGKPRMTREEFIKNNRGINDGQDLPEDYLSSIYHDIRENEIILEDEREAKFDLANQQPAGSIVEGIGRVIANAGRDLEREAYVQASEEMANKTEQLFRSLLKAQRRAGSSRPTVPRFIPASSSRHVGPMFEVTWMSFLSSLSGTAQESNDLEIIRLCMEGFKLAIRISCLFELETPRMAFVSALAKFTHLNNLSEMKPKNMEALKALLEVAQTEGNLLKNSWRDVLMCISQLERFQLISSGADEGSIPDVTKGRYVHNDSSEARPRSSMSSTRTARTRTRAQSHTFYVPEVAEEARAREVVIAVDRIFANTSNLNGSAIVDFVEALSEVSWQEIQSSGQSEHPRMFSLQKSVEIMYYNMGRIRVEWTGMWNVLGKHFNQVGTHSNTSVVFFALDSLRQLSMRFLEKEELAHFKFQKDFLSPFQYVMENHTVVPVKDMVLRCLSQMLQARGDIIKSGWRTMFGVFTQAAKENYDSIVNLAFDNVRRIYRDRFGVIVQQGAFGDMILCLTEFAKNQRFQKVSLQAIETLKGTVPVMLKCPECPVSHTGAVEDKTDTPQVVKEDPMLKYWFPVLFAFHDILMTGEDLEARTRALDYLFDVLTEYGGGFEPEFWDTICRELLFPIFMVLKSRSEKVPLKQESIGLWLSTTMIQALRNLIALLTHYFDTLERLLDGFLELLVTCICQENDTIARIGSSCLQQLILQSVDKLQPEHWAKIVSAFVQLFETTTADALFTAVPISGRTASSGTLPAPSTDLRQITESIVEDSDGENALKLEGLASDNTGTSDLQPPTEDDSATSETESYPRTAELEDYRPQTLHQQPVVTAQRRRFFIKIITKCVLQLLLIETVSELFQNDQVYNKIPSSELLRLMTLLNRSFSFARRFNNDKELRMRLWREGFMKHPPNLLKQESGSASTYVSILLRMYHDEGPERRQNRKQVEEALIPLCIDIIRGFIILEEETQHRNIVAWRPVVVDVLEGYTSFPEEDFLKHIKTFYALAMDMMDREGLQPDVMQSLGRLLRRAGELTIGIPAKRKESVSRRRKGSVAFSMRNGTGGAM